MATRKKKPNVPRIRDENCRYVYSNGVTAINTRYDMQFIFGQAIYESTQTFTMHEHTVIAMSPEHAKSFYFLLQRRLGDWEKTYGEIKIEKPVVNIKKR